MKKRGRGIGCNLYGIGYGFNRPDHSSAIVEVADDASVTVLTGVCDIGQGSETVLAMIAAEELGISYENVRVIFGDSATTPDALCTSASRQTFVSGKAVQLAAADAKDWILRYGAELLCCTREELNVVNGMIISSRNPEISVPFKDIALACHNDGKRFIGFAWYDNTTKDVDHENCQGDAYACYIYATQVADVEVDTDTGEVTVLRIAAAHDVGHAINPLNVEQQIEGAILQGMGYAITEEVILESGYTKTKNFSDYIIPTSLDAPEIKTYIVESEEQRGPFGAKGVGEGAIIPTAPAIVNAVYNAVGVRIKDLPITPEKLLKALEEKNKSGR